MDLTQKKIFAERLGLLRTKANMTQQQLADVTRIPRETIAKYETVKRIPSFEHLTIFAKRFKTTTDYLLGLSGTPTQDFDIKNVHKFTKLSEDSINEIINYPYKQELSEIIETELSESGIIKIILDYLNFDENFPYPQNLVVSKNGEVRIQECGEDFSRYNDLTEVSSCEIYKTICINRILDRLLSLKKYGFENAKKQNKYEKEISEWSRRLHEKKEQLLESGKGLTSICSNKEHMSEPKKEASKDGKHNPKKE